MSLRARIHLLVTGLTLLFIVASAYLLIEQTRDQIREEISASNRVTAQMMAAVLFSSRLFSYGLQQQATVQDFLQGLGRVRANEIRLIDPHGKRVYVSPPSTYKAGRSAPAWFTRLVGPTLSTARLRADSFVVEIVPDASRSVLDAWDNLSKFAWLAIGFFVLVNVLLYTVVSRSLRPVQSVVRGLVQAGSGDLSVRLPHYALPELQIIGDGFNRMLTDLQRSVAAERELAENRQFTQLIQSHLEEERRVLARELHDELGQHLTAIQTLAQATATRAAGRDPQTEEANCAIVGSAAQIYDAVHRIIRRLRPMALEQMGLADTLDEAVSEWRALYPGLRITLRAPADVPRLGDEIEIALFRIAQEAVTNAARHARATQVGLILDVQPGTVTLQVCDDGVGIADERLRDSGRNGLLGMRERVQGLGGNLHVERVADGGTCIHADIPRTPDRRD
ncbi:sensor histidine kinase [Solimonas marina]|uniref:histidine kinase n=1 Tax=Solimonas marina TaxID=2714601 RepID=A0A969W8E8_9GAMM|nr:sensor histidine kinase [Solimonas marina]NKF21898.1 HAMP domain-containing protein [Solimonas marina]